MANKEIGKLGEDLACEYLVKKGYRVLKRNYWQPWGEIDIVARAPDNTLVFAEVKTINNPGENSLLPEDEMSPAKIKKFRRICESFVAKNPDLLDEKRGWRMDLLAIELQQGIPSIRHYENI